MALFDPTMFDPQNYQGGLLSRLFGPSGVGPQLPQSAGFQGPLPQQVGDTYANGQSGAMGGVPFQIMGQPPQTPQTVDMSARSQTPPAPLTSAPPATQSPLYGQQAEPSLSDRLSAFAHNPAGAHGLIPKLMDAFTGLSTGVRTDPQGIAQAQLNSTYQALIKSGVPEATARAAALNPEILKTVAGAYFDTKPQFGVIGQNQMGVNQYGFIQPNQQKVTPANPGGGPMGMAGQIDPNLTGEAFLKAVSDSPDFGPGKAQIVKAIAEGRAPYPSGFLLKTPFGQWLTTAVGQYEPGVDANVIAQRRKLQTDLSASSPNSIGGILSNGKSAFEHLAELSDKAVGLGSKNGPNIPGGGAIANAENYVGSAFGTSDTLAKINAFNQNALKYGQESTKFYAGTGGGEAERMNALKSLDPKSSSGLEQAAFLENEKGLMLDRLRQKEQQIRSIMGDAYLSKHPVMTPELQQTISKIDNNIGTLRGGAPQASSAGGLPTGWTVKVQ